VTVGRHLGGAIEISLKVADFQIGFKNGSDPAFSASPFYPQEQTSSDHLGMSEKCQQRTNCCCATDIVKPPARPR
jgi:hypothetical protein